MNQQFELILVDYGPTLKLKLITVGLWSFRHQFVSSDKELKAMQLLVKRLAIIWVFGVS